MPLRANRVILLLLTLTFGALHAQAPRVAREAPLYAKFKLLDQINADRKAHGLPPVEYSEELSRVADEHCREMLLHNYTSHWNRAGWKPYVRYTQAGLHDYTGENIASVWGSHFPVDEPGVTKHMLESHARLMDEKPPNDGHRRSILTPGHQTVGIGVAFHENGMRMIEVFGRRDVELEPTPKSATLRSNVKLKGKLVRRDASIHSISVYYEPLPKPMSREELRSTSAYGLPREELVERPMLRLGQYTDGTVGLIQLDSTGRFTLPVRFWKREPGIYTLAVWIRTRQAEPAVATMTTIIVER